jgi:small subunit ribosomal protein S24e
MKLTVSKERLTPLLSRKRVTLEMNFKGATPSRKQIRDEVAKTVGTQKDLVVVRHIYNRFGVMEAKVIAHVIRTEKILRSLNKRVLSRNIVINQKLKQQHKVE